MGARAIGTALKHGRGRESLRERQHAVRQLGAAVAVFLACCLPLAWSPTAATAASPLPGGVRLVHGLRGVVADIYFDGKLLLDTFRPERSTALMSVSPGPHRVEVRLAGASPSSPPVLNSVLTVKSGENISAVIHLAANGKPEITQYVDQTGAVPANETRLIVRHTAAAPPIDVRLDATRVAVALKNPGQAAREVSAKTYRVSVTQTGKAAALAPVQDVPLTAGVTTDMYLIGDQKSATLGWIAVQTASTQVVPAHVVTGDSGLAAPRPAHRSVIVYTALALPVLGIGTVVGRRRRRLRAS
jgi:Domain of unknown function (DUF4397)